MAGRTKSAVLQSALLLVPVATSADRVTPPVASVTEIESISDTDIRLAVERELMLTRGVAADDIDVDTALGVVNLQGQVDNLLAKDRSERIASMVKGVKAVVNRIDVLPPVRSDADIQTDIKAALARDEATDSWEIGVVVDRGAETLTGQVDSWRERALAEKVARG